jgi:hypothetical protein
MTVELLTLLTPIVPGRTADLRQTLRRLPTGNESPFAGVPRTHTARWVVLEHFGMGDPARRRRLDPALLLFSAAFDGPLEPWLEDLRAGLGPTAEEVWSYCSRWPGTAGGTAFANWLLEHRVHHTLPFLGNPDATRTQIEDGQQLRQKLMDFTVWAHREQRSPAELRKGYEQAVSGAEVPELS